MTGTMRLTSHDGQLVCIALLDADQELLAEVWDDDPLFAQMEKLAERFSDAVSASPAVAWFEAGSAAPRKVWRTDTSKSDPIWREALQLVYRERCGTAALTSSERQQA